MAQGMVIRSSNLSTGEFPDALSKIYQHQSLLASLIDEKEAASCFWLLVSYSCYPFSSYLQISKISRFMGAVSIELSETRVEESSYGIPVYEHVEISWI